MYNGMKIKPHKYLYWKNAGKHVTFIEVKENERVS